MKIERLLQSQGFGTRRECRALVRAGLVAIGGETVSDPFAEVSAEGLEFTVDGEVWAWRERVFVMLHKPVGYECSHRPQHHPSIYTLLPEPMVARGVQSVGRLDHDTSGLLLLSDDGGFIHRWSSGKKRIPKTYEVVLKHAATEELVAALREGVMLRDESVPVRALACERTGERALRLTIGEGKYHQVKRMVAAAGNRVETLHRSHFGGLALPADLAFGEWRWLGEADLAALAEAVPALETRATEGD